MKQFLAHKNLPSIHLSIHANMSEGQLVVKHATHSEGIYAQHGYVGNWLASRMEVTFLLADQAQKK